MSELDSAIPLVFFDLRAGGQEVPSALVFVDGKPILDWTKGTALRLNPGEHVFHFDLPLHAPITQTVTLVRAARYKKIYADFVPIAATSAPAVGAPPPRVIQVHFERPVPFIVYPLLAVGAAGALTFTGFGVVGQLEQRNLEKSCAPRCTDGDKSSMRRMFLTADLSLGIGATALIGAGVFYLGRPEKASGPIVGAKLLPGGGAATLTLQHF